MIHLTQSRRCSDCGRGSDVQSIPHNPCLQVKRSAANFNAEELPLATSIFKGIDYTRQKGPPESLRVGQHN